MSIRPSSLPALKECPRFESGPAKSFTHEGTKRHEALASMFWVANGEVVVQQQLDEEWAEQLDDESIEGIHWAADYIQIHAPLADHELRIESKGAIVDENFTTIMEGTKDYECGPHLFDIKWRRRNYREQMAAYALMMIQEHGYDSVTVHILFMESKHPEVFKLNESECWSIIESVRETASDPEAKPVPCDYCSWCRNHIHCEAVNERVEAVVNGRDDWELEQYHASKITDPEELSKAITIARIVSKWADAVEHFAKDYLFSGKEIPGWEMKAKAGRRVIPSVMDAFARCGMDQDKFLECCNVTFSKLVEARRVRDGVSKRVAEKELERMLGDACGRSKPSYQLTKTKSKN